MNLIQILYPLADNNETPFPKEILREIQSELIERFGGITAYSRAPAKGIWTNKDGKQQDDIIIVEVMTDSVDNLWWIPPGKYAFDV